MSNQTFKNDENSDQKNKKTPVTESSRPIESISPGIIYASWLGWRDSNPRMHGPKPCALPLGHTPMYGPEEILV